MYLYHVPPDMMDWEGYNITSMIFFLRADNLDLITKKHQANPNWGTHYKVAGEYLKNVKVMKYMERLRNWQTEENGEDMTIKCNIGSALHRGPEEGKHMKTK